jgi:hypothetical protein
VWHKPLSLNLCDEEDEDDFSVMNIEDFLTEHSVEIEEDTLDAMSPRLDAFYSSFVNISRLMVLFRPDPHLGENNFGFEDTAKAARRPGNVVKNADTSFLYAESKAAK